LNFFEAIRVCTVSTLIHRRYAISDSSIIIIIIIIISTKMQYG